MKNLNFLMYTIFFSLLHNISAVSTVAQGKATKNLFCMKIRVVLILTTTSQQKVNPCW